MDKILEVKAQGVGHFYIEESEFREIFFEEKRPRLYPMMILNPEKCKWDDHTIGLVSEKVFVNPLCVPSVRIMREVQNDFCPKGPCEDCEKAE